MSMVVTNVDTGSSAMGDNEFDTSKGLVFSGAGTEVDGTLLGRKAISNTVTVAADGGNTGDGTVTGAAPSSDGTVAVVGAYNLECVAAVTNGGVFKLEDPSGNLIASDLTMNPGAGAATSFVVGGLTFTITDGAADFIVGDKFSLTTTADGNFYVYDVDGSGGTQIPVAVLTYDVTATGAGTVPIHACISGKINATRLIIAADGDGSNITSATLDQLRDFTLVAVPVTQLAQLDNQ